MNVLSFLRRAALPGLLLATACQRPEEVNPPAGLLPKGQMVSLLVSQHLLEARIEASRLSPDSARALFLSQQRELFWENHLPEDSVFERSYRYYSQHGKDLEEIYAVVVDSLQATERHLTGNTWDDEPSHH